jgi:flagellar motor switch protein FliG
VPAPNSQPITGASACDQAHAEAYTEAQAEAQPLPRELCRSSFANTANHVETDPIEQLLQTDSNQLADALRHERPQAIAVLLTRFTSRHASETLAGLPTDLQIEVIRRLKSLGDISPELVHEIARSVARRLRSIVAEDSMTESSAVNRIAHLFETPASSKVCV